MFLVFYWIWLMFALAWRIVLIRVFVEWSKGFFLVRSKRDRRIGVLGRSIRLLMVVLAVACENYVLACVMFVGQCVFEEVQGFQPLFWCVCIMVLLCSGELHGNRRTEHASECVHDESVAAEVLQVRDVLTHLNQFEDRFWEERSPNLFFLRWSRELALSFEVHWHSVVDFDLTFFAEVVEFYPVSSALVCDRNTFLLRVDLRPDWL